jgi:hypothetical protein
MKISSTTQFSRYSPFLCKPDTATTCDALSVSPGNVFQKQMFVDTGKRWLRTLWNCELRGALAAGFFWYADFWEQFTHIGFSKTDSEQLL